MRNDSLLGTVANVSIENLQVVDKMQIYGKVCVPEHERDNEYQRVIIRTVIDMEKLSKGLYSNFVTKSLVDSVLKSIDFELKLPFRKRIYRATNLSVSDYLVPSYLKAKFLLNVRFVGSVQWNSSKLLLGTLSIFGERKVQ